MNKDNIKAVLQFVSEGRLNAVINKYGDGVPCATKKEAIEKVADLVFNRKVEMSEVKTIDPSAVSAPVPVIGGSSDLNQIKASIKTINDAVSYTHLTLPTNREV